MNIMYISRFGPEDGSPVLLLHGGGVAGWMWNSLRRSLASKYNVLVPDLPGHGQSADQPYRSHTETVDALNRILAHGGSTPVAVIGFSLGAQLTIELASKHPELVDRAMVVSAQAKAMPFTGLTLGALGAAAPLARNRRFARMQARELFLPPELMEDYLDTSANITKATLLAAVGDNMRFELPAAWSEFPGQALVMVGRRERALMRDSAAAIHTALPGSEIEIVDGCGHGIPLQRSDWFNGRVADWLLPQ
ncbi:alpha/beta hydrolase [Arthrobacter sp. MYb227]|uniref:alpha/beta fold hydrolase n=1 Tax=Arthrobacter sp. MYb227 TaxID=1848601 RepID=UPI00280B91E4|nr:alpha/beta hydrolase [Arthrobacter sp. MYb227]